MEISTFCKHQIGIIYICIYYIILYIIYIYISLIISLLVLFCFPCYIHITMCIMCPSNVRSNKVLCKRPCLLVVSWCDLIPHTIHKTIDYSMRRIFHFSEYLGLMNVIMFNTGYTNTWGTWELQLSGYMYCCGATLTFVTTGRSQTDVAPLEEA